MELEGIDKRWETSLARSATLGDKSWARLTTELTSWNLADSQLCLESKTELVWQKHQTTLGGEIHRTEKHIVGGGDTALTFFMGGTIGVGTPHNIEREHK